MNKDKFEQIYNDLAEDIYRFCYFKTGNREESEDLTSEVFIKLYNQDESSIENPKAWAYKVCRNLIIDKFYKNKTKMNNSDITTEEISENQIQVAKSNPELEAINKVLLEQFEEELKNLDSDSQDILVMKIWDDLKFSEIAEATDLSLSNVKQKFYRGLEFIKNKVSVDEKLAKTSVFAFTIGALFQITKSPAYAFSGEINSSIASSIDNNLNINFLEMENRDNEATRLQDDQKREERIGDSDENNRVGVAAVGASSSAGTAANVAGGGILGGFLATAGGKVALGLVAATVLIAGAGVGIVVTQNDSNEPEEVVEEPAPEPDPVVEEPEDPEPIPEPEPNIQTYTNEYLSDFAINYDADLWDLTEVVNTPLNPNDPIPYYEADFIMESKEYDSTLYFSSQVLTGIGWGPTGTCYDNQIANIGGNVARFEAASEEPHSFTDNYFVDYIYRYPAYFPGSNEFNNIVDELENTLGMEVDNPTVCVSIGPGTITADSSIGPEYIGIVNIGFDADNENLTESLDAAEEVILSLSYEGAFEDLE